ncbi:uncharacterized protein [Onthophagus taurus]|uniref:uncharacterized protein isoform X2 n=1 Tax=Onthophagus taurus TaxID=166361 RepID=UPI0039BE6906
MKCYVSFLCILSLFFAISHAAPAISAAIGSQGSGAVDPTELLMRISDKFSQNIQILRRFCPPLFQIIDNVVQNVTSQLFSVVGRVVLRSGLGGGLGGGGGESMVSVVLPTFPPDDDEESTEVMEVSTIPQQPALLDESYVRRIDSEPTTEASIILPPALITTNQAPITSSSQAPIELPLSVNEIRVDSDEQALYTSKVPIANKINIRFDNDDPEDITTSSSIHRNENKTDSALEDRIASIYKGLELQDTKDIISPATQVRAKREAETSENDQEPAASGGNGPEPAEDLSDVAEEGDRDKRYSPFGGDAAHGGGGSGNFLFDIIRQTADGAARAAGTIYRMVAGTENLGIGLSASASSTRIVDPSSQLVAGSGATEESDEKEHGGVGAGGVAEIDVAKGADGYTEGIPGPITRLFVIANRGLANLVQDLILRLAQTSERIVNFKARLITALI